MKAIELFEALCKEEVELDILHEMANITQRVHGIDDVVIWVGMENKRYALRVKVSNIRNKWSAEENFVIQMPSLDYNPTSVAKWIPIRKILEWIKFNQKYLYDYETVKTQDTLEFLQQLSNFNDIKKEEDKNNVCIN